MYPEFSPDLTLKSYKPEIKTLCWSRGNYFAKEQLTILTINHILYLYFQDTIKQLQEELRSIEEAEKLCISFTEWLSSTQKSFTVLSDSAEPLDRVTMEEKMKKLEVLS